MVHGDGAGPEKPPQATQGSGRGEGTLRLALRGELSLRRVPSKNQTSALALQERIIYSQVDPSAAGLLCQHRLVLDWRPDSYRPLL